MKESVKQQEKENEQKVKQRANVTNIQNFRASELQRGNQSAQRIRPQKENNNRDFNLVDFSFSVASRYISGHTSAVCLFLDVELLFYYTKNYNHSHFDQCYILDY